MTLDISKIVKCQELTLMPCLAFGDGRMVYLRRQCGGYRHRAWYNRAENTHVTDPTIWPIARHVLDLYFLGPSTTSTRGLIIPIWTLLCVTAVPPLAHAVRLFTRRGSRPDAGCRKCGYDLRASKDRCPECGTPIPAEAKA